MASSGSVGLTSKLPDDFRGAQKSPGLNRPSLLHYYRSRLHIPGTLHPCRHHIGERRPDTPAPSVPAGSPHRSPSVAARRACCRRSTRTRWAHRKSRALSIKSGSHRPCVPAAAPVALAPRTCRLSRPHADTVPPCYPVTPTPTGSAPPPPHRTAPPRPPRYCSRRPISGTRNSTRTTPAAPRPCTPGRPDPAA